MPLILRGRSKARLEIQWSGPLPISIRIVPQDYPKINLYETELRSENRAQVELDQLDFSRVGDLSELNLIAWGKWQKGQPESVSEALPVQKCYHTNCEQWGLAREDGYCRHCGRRIKDQGYSYGFPKLEISKLSISLWDGTDGRLWKKKETRETNNGVYSMGRYEDRHHYRDYVEILEEKYDSELSRRFVHLHKILQELDMLDKCWKPPLASFQEEYQRSVWVYYPWLPRQKKWREISALSYIFAKETKLITTRDIINIGIQLCKIAENIHSHGHLWASLKLSDLILSRKKGEEITIYLRSRDIAWCTPQKNLLDTCLIPWELFWEEELRGGHEVTEVYIIAALLYFLKAKTANLLSYNSLSYPYGLPTLKLFLDPQDGGMADPLNDYFEATLNQALLLNPLERGYKSVHELRCAFEQLLKATPPKSGWRYRLDVGNALDVGDEKRDSDMSENQDAIFITNCTLERESWGVFVLCDGVSTATVGSGDQASKIIIETFRDWWSSQSREQQQITCRYASTNISRACSCLNDVVSQANRKIRKKAETLASSEVLEESLVMGSTITLGMIDHGAVVFGWLGDSPLYRVNPFFGWERLNYDHNERNYRLKEGMPLEECFIEGGNALTHCVGAHFYIENDVCMPFGHTFLYPGEHIVICSDGISDYIEREAAYAHNENYQMMRVASILYEYERDTLIDANAMASILVSGANRIGGGLDNLSAIVIRVLPENSASGDKAYQRLKALCKSMQTVMRQTNLETRRIMPPRGDLSYKKNIEPSWKNSEE